MYESSQSLSSTVNFGRTKPKHIVIENDIGIYNGELNKECLRHGYGMYKWKKNGDVYEGFWEHNLRNGKGEYLYSDGSIYRGEWVDDLKHGKGSYKFNNFEFDGIWEKDHLSTGFVFRINKFQFLNEDDLKPMLNDNFNNFSILDEEYEQEQENELTLTPEELKRKIAKSYERLCQLKKHFNLNLEVKSFKKDIKDTKDYVFDNILKVYDKVRSKQSKSVNNILIDCSICKQINTVNNSNSDQNASFSSMSTVSNISPAIEVVLNCNCQKIASYFKNFFTEI